MRREAATEQETIADTVRRAVEAALAAVLQAQQRPKKKTTEPPPARRVKRQIAKTAADPTKPPRDRHGFRGTPPPADFSLAELRDDSLLTEYEVASLTRISTSTLASWRKRDDPRLEWLTIGGGRCIRYRVAAVKQFVASGYRPQPGRPRKKDENAAPAPSSRRGGAA